MSVWIQSGLGCAPSSGTFRIRNTAYLAEEPHAARRLGSRRRQELEPRWRQDPRWQGIERPYTAEDVRARCAAGRPVEHTLARLGAERLWELLAGDEPVARARRRHRRPGRADGAAGLQAIYLSGWQVAAEANLAGHTYPDQSLYPANSVPALVRRLNNALLRADQIDCAEGRDDTHWLAPIVADAEAGFGGAAQRVRADEGDDRGGRRRRALRGPARGREEVRPSRRQGARPDEPVRPHAHRGAARGRRARRADGARRAHRRAAARRCSRATSTADARVRHRRADAEGFFRVRDGIEAAIARGARVRAVRRPALVRDLDARPRRGARVRAGDPRAVPGQAARLQLLAVVQLEAPPRRRRDRAASGRRSASSATASSSSRSPASTR